MVSRRQEQHPIIKFAVSFIEMLTLYNALQTIAAYPCFHLGML